MGSVGLYSSWDETMCLTFVRSKWQGDLNFGTSSEDGDMYCSNDISICHS